MYKICIATSIFLEPCISGYFIPLYYDLYPVHVNYQLLMA